MLPRPNGPDSATLPAAPRKVGDTEGAMAEVPVQVLARRLFDAATERRTIAPLTDEHPDLTEADAYRIQDALVALHVADGAVPAGMKLGLTSRAKQREMGIDVPIVGALLDRMALDPGAALSLASLGQARAEPEIAFLVGRELEGPGITAAHVLAATEAVLPAIEILDSRYRDYRFTLPDVVADQTSAGRFLLGGQLTSPRGFDLRLVGCAISRNGTVAATAAGAAVSGHPASAVAWLVRCLAARGRGLRAGDIVLSGGLTAVVALAVGDVITAAFDRLGSVTLACR
jgi:2-oxo-3-hexenedioate decarboxylase